MNTHYNKFLLCALLLLTGCYRKPAEKKMKEVKTPIISRNITFYTENKTIKTLYACCFYYAKLENEERWIWHKSNTVSLAPGKASPISLPLRTTQYNFNNIQGYLSIFENKDDADMAIIELLADEQRIDIGHLHDLNNKHLAIASEQYGFKGERLFLAEPIEAEEKPHITIENQLDENVIVTGFIYEHLGAHPQWDFEKLEVMRIKQHETKTTELPVETNKKGWDTIRCYLAIFKENQIKDAQDATYESLTPSQKLNVGSVSDVQSNKIILVSKNYGVLKGFDANHPDIEFSIKPRHPLPEQLQSY